MQTQRKAPNPALAEFFNAFSLKADLARAAARAMKRTPEYAAARDRGEARAWLYRESHSYAESAYELLLTRLTELEP